MARKKRFKNNNTIFFLNVSIESQFCWRSLGCVSNAHREAKKSELINVRTQFYSMQPFKLTSSDGVIDNLCTSSGNLSLAFVSFVSLCVYIFYTVMPFRIFSFFWSQSSSVLSSSSSFFFAVVVYENRKRFISIDCLTIEWEYFQTLSCSHNH